MPLAFRTIQPVLLGRRPLTDDEDSEDVAPIAVCHNAFVGVIVQLASLVRHADDLFCDLAEECQRVFEKTDSICAKIRNIERITTQLDSTQVTIPVGTLKQFSSLTDHHIAKHGFDCDHFTPANRPYCIRFSYSMCELTPVHLLRGVDPFRKDGLSSSHLFKLWPIALKEMDWHANEMTVPRRYSSPLAQKKRYKSLRLKERRRTIHSIDEIYHKEASADLQASKAGSLSRSQPSILVSVDTSGSGFERMILFRQSLSGDINDSRNKRRRTVSGISDILQEIEQFETGHRILRDGPRMYSLDDLDQKELDARDEIMQQYLVEIDSAIAEREEEEYVEQRQKKLLKFIPCRRSRSLPRCVKLLTSRGHGELTLSSMFPKKMKHKQSGEEAKVKPATDEISLQDKFSSNASLGSLSGDDSKSVRSSKRSSLIGDKIKSLVTNTLKPRPKSLDFDSIEVIDDSKKTSTSKSKSRSSSLSRVNSPSRPEGTMTRTDSTESQVGPGSYYYFDSNTIPRAQAKKYDFPWDSLPKDWTTSVKLREISKRRKEDRQSSSGNWSQSGCSSNRQSVDSDAKSSMPSTMSQHSLGKDSGRDSPRSAGDRDGLDTGYMGDAASTESVSDTKSVSNTDSDDWIRSLAEQAAHRGDVTSTSAEALASLSRLTKQNIRNLDILMPGRTLLRQKRNELEDDGESSIYSIDQEGFYTSFHSDSGLKRSTNTLLDDDDEDYDLMMPRVRETRSLQNVIGYSTMKNGNAFIDSSSAVSAPDLISMSFGNSTLPNINEDDVIDTDFSEDVGGEVEYGNSGTLKARKKPNKMKKVPPLPPPRTTSINSDNNQTQNGSDEALSGLDDSPASIETSSECSDHETIYARLKMKTSISAHTFPSWCVGLASDEDEFQDRLHAESSEVEELFSGKDSWISGTLPRTNAGSDPNEIDQTTNSWPRIKRTNPQQSGILKTTEKDKTKPNASNPKVLNFDPVVNLFDATSPHSVQMPLSRLSSSDESSSTSTNSFDAQPLTGQQIQPLPLLNEHSIAKPDSYIRDKEQLSYKNVSSKYQPTFTAKHGSARPRSMVLHPSEISSSSTPVHGHHSINSGNVYLNSSDFSVVHSGSNPSLDSTDSFNITLMAPLTKHDKSENALNSNSTIALSDIDSSSLTYVTMSDSSPSGSSLSLNWDTDDTPNPTPMATPVRKHAPLSLSCSTNNTTTIADRNPTETVKFDANSAQQIHVTSLSDHARASTMLSAVSSSQAKEGFSLSDGLGYTFHNSGSTKPNLASSHLSQGPSNVSQASTVSMAPTSYDVISGIHSDKNNNRSKTTHFAYSDSVILKQEFKNQGITNQKHPHPAELQLQPPLTNSRICTNKTSLGSYHQQVMSSSYNERRRSSPSADAAVSSSGSTSNSGNDDSSEAKGSKASDSVKRRRSDLYSPADSGYGSPPVSSQPSSASQTFTYSSSKTPQPYVSIVHAQVHSAHLPSSSSVIREPFNRDSKIFLSNFVTDSTSTSVGNITRPDYPNILRQTSNQSIESLSSQFSTTSTQQLIPKVPKTDLSQPALHRENSNESVHSSSSGARSDSYRVAMSADSEEITLIPNKIPNINNSNGSVLRKTHGSHRSQLTKSLPVPAPAIDEDDAVSRADSYRCAVRNTQSMLFGDAYGRNSSYRLATCEEDVVITDNRMDSCNLWTGKTGATRDVRRMGITDVDQLKHYNESDDNDKSGNRRSLAKFSNTIHSKKKLSAQTETEGLINPPKLSSSEHKRFMRSSSKDKAKQKTQSSTYIRFDPIFESGEDLRASNESLRPPSIVSIRTLTKVESNETIASENTNLIRQKVGSASPPRKRSSSHGRRDDKSSLSIFGSIKTTIKSIGGTKGE